MPLPPELADFLPEFQKEVQEHLQKLEYGLLMLEAQADDGELLNQLFRSAHTVKGSGRMMGFEQVGELAHAMEDLFARYRDRTLTPAAGGIDLLLDAVDLLRVQIEQAPGEEQSAAELVLQLRHVVDGATTGTAASGATPTDVGATPDAPAAPPPGGPARSAPPAERDSMRVSVSQLDDLLRLMAEMVLVGQQIDQMQSHVVDHLALIRVFRRAWAGDELADARAKVLFRDAEQLRLDINRIARELTSIRESLEHSVISLRLVPMDDLLNSLVRPIRDLARQHGKQVDLVIDGGDTRIDRSVLQMLREPLIHLVRNAIDHGIEPPDQRRAHGKPAAGTLRIAAQRRGSAVSLTVADDGAGIDPARVRASAVNKGILTAAQAALIDDTAALELIYHPGMSTASEITHTSGRGVGMDAVRAALNSIGGIITISSQPGLGTTFTLELPGTLALLRVLMVGAADQVFAIPDSAVERVLRRVDSSLLSSSNGHVRFSHNNEALILKNLSTIVDRVESVGGEQPIVVLRAGDQRIGLTVDRVLDEREVVLKPLGRFLSASELALGATFLPSGGVVTILDPTALARIARIPQSPRVSTGGLSGASQYRILVVEDSVIVREMQRRILLEAGYQVVVAAEPQTALRLMREQPPSLVVSDIEMPGMDGYQMCEIMRREPLLSETPVVFVTGLENESEVRRGLEVGAQAYIRKSSFSQHVLLETVARLLP